ncbi:uncharacterized protein LOC119741968 [Patiria miniata]|uniref:Uncharacterized protein n=1 Tax=Patiria miniata TaxID=46514 RepID=A0A914BEM4_PATMI|nr:uncharacterized protein LOC119741968 [Patiria miniata]
MLACLVLLLFAMCPYSTAMPIPITSTLIKETMNQIQLSDLHGKMVPVDLVLLVVLIYFGKRLREHSKKVKWEKKYRKRPFMDPTEHQCFYYTYPVPGPTDPDFPTSKPTRTCRTSGPKCTIQEIPTDSIHEYEHIPSLP